WSPGEPGPHSLRDRDGSRPRPQGSPAPPLSTARALDDAHQRSDTQDRPVLSRPASPLLAAAVLPALLWAPPSWRAAVPEAAAASAGQPVVLPVAGPSSVLRGFEPPPAGTPWLPGHRGVDLAAAAWSSIRSAASGVVAFAGPVGGHGVVVVRSGPLRWTY